MYLCDIGLHIYFDVNRLPIPIFILYHMVLDQVQIFENSFLIKLLTNTSSSFRTTVNEKQK